MVSPKDLAQKARSVSKIISEAVEENSKRGLAKHLSPEAAERLLKRFTEQR